MAEIYDKGPGEKTLILNVREWFVYPFEAPNWLDLRAGAFLSITDASNDDLPNGAFAETIALPTPLVRPPRPADRYWIGLKSKTDAMPMTWRPNPRPGEPPRMNVFCGFTNSWFGANTDKGDSKLVTSDNQVGTTNANFWRAANSLSDVWNSLISEDAYARAHIDGLPQHFPRDVVAAGGYSVLLAVQLTRESPQSTVITMNVKATNNNADMLYANTPSNDLLHSTLSNWTADLRSAGPVQVSQVPDALYFYWPFRASRLRIHACGVLKAS